MRPVNRGAQPTGYAPPVQLNFHANIPAWASLGVNANLPVRVDQCLLLWDTVTDRKARQIGLSQAEKTVKKVISDRIGDLYRAAGPWLLQRLGAYCSYCESGLPGQLDVEHTMPKDPYPLLCLSWDNFLVGCTACNSVKRNNPDRATARNHLQNNGTPNPAIGDYYRLIRQENYIWPDLTALSYRAMPIWFYYLDAAGMPHLLHYIDAVHRAVRIVAKDPHGQQIRADVVDGPVLHQNVPVFAVPGYAHPRGLDMINLCGLHRTGGTITDRRVFNRTEVWLRAAVNINRVLQAQTQAQLDVMWDMLLDLARSSGFYSVWLALLAAAQPAWAPLFVQQTNNWQYFPGTNTAHLP